MTRPIYPYQRADRITVLSTGQWVNRTLTRRCTADDCTAHGISRHWIGRPLHTLRLTTIKVN